MQHLTLPAPAKLNLFLHILGRREDGYHNIQTVYQFVDFSDVLSFHLLKKPQIKLTPELYNVSHKKNLIIKAVKQLQKTTGCRLGVNITLNKKLPIGAGLGGGSSDAATTLVALNRLWKLNLSLDELAKLGITLGGDVPVFIYGHAAWAEGIGDQLTPIILPEPWYLLLIPPYQVETRKMYNDPRLTRDSAALKITGYRPGDGHNDFETLVRLDYPEIAKALDWLKGVTTARMSGSGGVVFGQFDTREEASRIAAQVPMDYKTVITKGLNHSPLQVALAHC